MNRKPPPKIDDLVDYFLKAPLPGLLSIGPPHRTERAVLWASANRLHRRPHIFIRLHQVPARRQKLLSLDLSAVIDSLGVSRLQVAKHLSPRYIPVALDHGMRRTLFERLLRKQGRVNASVYHGGARSRASLPTS